MGMCDCTVQLTGESAAEQRSLCFVVLVCQSDGKLDECLTFSCWTVCLELEKLCDPITCFFEFMILFFKFSCVMMRH